MPERRINPADVEPVDLVAPTRVVRGRLPAIEAIQDRLSRQLRADLFRRFRYGVQIQDARTSFEAHDEVMGKLKAPVYVGILSMPPLRGFSVIAIDGDLIGAVVDRLCGATEPDNADRRQDFSQLEIRIAKQLMDVIRGSLEFAWHSVANPSIEVVRTEINTSFIAIADGQESLITMRMQASLATGAGEIVVGTPYPSIDPIRDRLATTAAMTETPEEDKRHWRTQLQHAAGGIPVEVHANLTTTEMRTADVAALQPGQILPIRIPPLVRAYSGPTALFDAEYGCHGDHHALRVARFIDNDTDAEDDARHVRGREQSRNRGNDAPRGTQSGNG